MQDIDIWVFLQNMFSTAVTTESPSCFTLVSCLYFLQFVCNCLCNLFWRILKHHLCFTETLSVTLFPLLTHFLCKLPTQTASGKPAHVVWVSSGWRKQGWSYLYALHYTVWVFPVVLFLQHGITPRLNPWFTVCWPVSCWIGDPSKQVSVEQILWDNGEW